MQNAQMDSATNNALADSFFEHGFIFANEIVRQPKILDVIESIIGPDIVVWGSTLQNEAIVDGALAASLVAAGNAPDGTKAG